MRIEVPVNHHKKGVKHANVLLKKVNH